MFNDLKTEKLCMVIAEKKEEFAYQFNINSLN